MVSSPGAGSPAVGATAAAAAACCSAVVGGAGNDASRAAAPTTQAAMAASTRTRGRPSRQAISESGSMQAISAILATSTRP